METNEAIRNAFMELYAHEPFERITVKELCAAVPVARTTFYAHYGNTDDVRLEVEDLLLEGIDRIVQSASGGDLPHMDFVAFLDALFEYIIQNRAWFQAFLVDQPNSRFVTKWRAAITANFAQRAPQATKQPNWDLLAEMGASAAVGAYAYWMQHPENVDIHEVKGLVDRALTAVMDI